MNNRMLFLMTAMLLGLFLAACAPPDGATSVPTPAQRTPTPAMKSSVTAAQPESPAEPAQESMADVVSVKAVQAKDGSWTFSVTIRHPDTGWDDYADGWDVVPPDGQAIKVNPDDPFTRLLLHPHVNEQPFTRSQSGVRIPDGVTQVTVRAHSLARGFGGREVVVDLTKDAGDGFEVHRAQPLAAPQSKSSVAPAAYIYPRSDGNHLAAGNGNFPDLVPLDIQLSGKPLWVAGIPWQAGVDWQLPMAGVLSTNLSVVTLPDGGIALAAGGEAGVLRCGNPVESEFVVWGFWGIMGSPESPALEELCS